MEDLNGGGSTRTHKVTMTNRRNCMINGVNDVLSFDIHEILLETEQGMLTIKGSDLHVNRLTLEKGEVDIEGRIDSLAYSEVADFHKAGASLLGRSCFLQRNLLRIFLTLHFSDFCYNRIRNF